MNFAPDPPHRILGQPDPRRTGLLGLGFVMLALPSRYSSTSPASLDYARAKATSTAFGGPAKESAVRYAIALWHRDKFRNGGIPYFGHSRA